MSRRNGKGAHLTPDPKNARRHGERNKSLIRESLETVGPLRSIGVDGDNIIRAGNGVYDQAQALGLKVRVVDAAPDELIAVRRPDLKGKRAIEAALFDNRAGEVESTWNTDVLAEIAERDGDLLRRMFEGDKDVLAAIGPQEQADAEPQIDRAEELNKKWKVETGDLWRIGEHRLLCGDSTRREDVERVMDKNIAALFCTDPPYGVAYGDLIQEDLNRSKQWSRITNDDLTDVKLQTFLESVFTTWLPFLHENAAWYLWHAQKTQGYFTAAAAAGVIYHRQIVWIKPRLILGRGHFHWRHELCLYGWRKSHEPHFYGGHNKTTVWEFDRPGNEREHPTQKPLECFSWPMQFSTKPRDICAEPFGGSGSQFVAGQNTGRRVFGMEIEQNYCAVTLERMATAFPGIEIERLDASTQKSKAHRKRTQTAAA